MNGWSYVDNNPVNFTDPTGMKPWFRAAHCMTVDTSREYAECVREEYGVDPPDSGVDTTFPFKGEPNCWFGDVPYRARGYVEGWSSVPVAVFLGLTVGMEAVYDFATMERNGFTYVGGVLQDSAGGSGAEYLGDVYGFRSWDWPDNSVTEDYKDWFQFFSGGISAGLIAGTDIIGPGIGVGGVSFQGVPDSSVYGEAYYLSFSLSFDPVPILDFGIGFTYYVPDNFWYENYRNPEENGPRISVQVEKMMADMLSGTGPVGFSALANGPISQGLRGKFIGGIAHKYIHYFNQIHYESYPDD